MIKDLIVNAFIIIFPILAYQFIFMEIRPLHTRKQRYSSIGLICGITGILCISFPIEVYMNIHLDMRWIPCVVAYLYGGAWGGGIATGMILIYRSIQFGKLDILIGLLSVSVFITTASLFCRKEYENSRRIVRIWIGNLIVFLMNILVLLEISIAYPDQVLHEWKMIGIVYITSWLSVGMTIYLIETVRENYYFKKEISRSEQLSLVSELAASIAHEVRNPLTVVRGFIQLGKTSIDGKQRTYMETALTELDRAEKLLSDYLDFAKPHKDKSERISVSEKLWNAMNIVSSYALMNRVEMAGEIQEGLYIQGNKDKFKQALLNLMKNAIEAMPNGGTLRIEACQMGENITVRIADSGVGLTPEQLLKLGDPFYTTKSTGTGLGISVTIRLLETMNATLKYFSKPGKGTTAQITVPADGDRLSG